MVAAIFKLQDTASISAFDDREKRGSCREEVPIKILAPLAGRTLPQGQVWIYVTKSDLVHPVSEKHPIVQSYVDVFISGCFEIQEKFNINNFAAECITTTHDWSKSWVNDRIMPRRPFVHQPRAIDIDLLLHKTIPEYFAAIRIE
jgi:hypothetical protein